MNVITPRFLCKSRTNGLISLLRGSFSSWTPSRNTTTRQP